MGALLMWDVVEIIIVPLEYIVSCGLPTKLFEVLSIGYENIVIDTLSSSTPLPAIEICKGTTHSRSDIILL